MALARFLPSKKLSFTAGALVVGGGLILGAYIWGNVKEPRAALSLDDVITKAAEVDSDGDGLKDWEESIRGTDPQNPDTDGDGTIDGIEVSSNRDPLTPGPNDRATTTPNALFVEGKAYTEDEDVTEDVSKEFLARYLTLKAENRLDELTQQELITALSASVRLDRQVQVHREGDFAVVSDTMENLKAYGNGIVAATATHQQYASYLALLNAIGLALDTDGIKGKDAFDATRGAYRAMVDEYATLAVPKSIAGDHLEYLNLFEKAIAPLPDIERVAIDPVRGIAGLQQYQENLSKATLMLKRIGGKIDPDGILFSKDEPGYLLRNLQSIPQ